MLAAMAHYVAFCQQFAELRIWAFLTHASSRNLNFLHISICVWLIEIPTSESEDWFGYGSWLAFAAFSQLVVVETPFHIVPK